MSDFIREVDEDYRRDRAVALFKRLQVPLAVLVVAIIAGAGGWRWWEDRQETEAEAVNLRYAAAAALAKDGQVTAAADAFAALAKDAPAGYATLARLRAAEALAGADPEAGAKALDVIATDTNLPASIRDTALVRGALLRVDREDPKAFESRYGRFSIPGFSYHATIRELLALAAMKRGDHAAAGRYLDDIIADPGAPSPLRNRAEAFRLLNQGGAVTMSTTQPGPAKVEPAQTPAPAPAAPMPAPAAPAPAPPSGAPQ